MVASAAGAGLLLVLVGFALYFLPTIVAAARKVPNIGSIVVINLFLGWTFVVGGRSGDGGEEHDSEIAVAKPSPRFVGQFTGVEGSGVARAAFGLPCGDGGVGQRGRVGRSGRFPRRAARLRQSTPG
jgi:hypothetical protein